MKDWLQNLKGSKGAPWLLLLLLCAGLCLLLSASGGTEGDMTKEERRVSATLSRIAGAGQTRVSIYYAAESAFGASGAPIGAVIVSRGAGDLAVRLDLMRAAQTLLGLPASAVEVFPMEDAP